MEGVWIFRTVGSFLSVRNMFLFAVVVGPGGASFNHATHSKVFYSNGSQHKGQAPPKGYEINQRAREIINGVERKKKHFCNINL